VRTKVKTEVQTEGELGITLRGVSPQIWKTKPIKKSCKKVSLCIEVQNLENLPKTKLPTFHKLNIFTVEVDFGK
jgi:hypothetical protein